MSVSLLYLKIMKFKSLPKIFFGGERERSDTYTQSQAHVFFTPHDPLPHLFLTRYDGTPEPRAVNLLFISILWGFDRSRGVYLSIN